MLLVGISDMILHFVQDLATPHNKSLVRALRARGDLRVVTWYAMRTSGELPWKEGLADSLDNYYYDNWPNRFKLMWRALFHQDEKFLVVGYANLCTRFILGVSWVLNRKVIYWSDRGEDKQRFFFRSGLRRLAFHILRRRGDPVCVVGRRTLKTFKAWGFSESQLVNLPIFIDVPPLPDRTAAGILAVRQKYGVGSNDVLFVAASRLVYQKGYDLLIEAMGRIERRYLESCKLLIIGSGPERDKLDTLVARHCLGEYIQFEPWLEPEDYARVLSAADVFVHPARFDAFGGGTLYAMALGVPVIGSDGVGSAIERVKSGKNGLIYPREDVQALTNCMVRLLINSDERRTMGLEARATAEEWPPGRGAQIIKDIVEGKRRYG
jgi:glycosyltransferase involved in cell wall biosynthesis